MNFRPLILLLPLLATTLLTGCAGYRLGEVKPEVYAGIERIHIPPFKNLTLEPRLSSLVTNAVIAELQADGTYQVADRQRCDAVLVGTIRVFEKRQLRAVRTDTLRSQELSIFLYIDFHLENPTTGAKIDGSPARASVESAALPGKEGNGAPAGARQGTVIGQTIQFVDPSFQVSERNALSVVAQDAATKLVSRLANGW